MIGGLDAKAWAALLIGVAVVGGIARLTLWRRSSAESTKGPAWRFAALIALQVVAGLLLWLTLFPPQTTTTPGRLVILTDGAKPGLPATGDIVVALPEAGPIAGATRAPDLGSALRLYPAAGRLRIEGEGLVARDQIPLDRPAAFIPTKPPRGLVSLALPAPVAPGARLTVGGQVGALPAGVVELVDPAGAIVDRKTVAANARFQLTAGTRAAGVALFDLRLRDPAGRLVEHVEIPVEIRAQRPPRVLVLAGAPSPETKYLRRWAQDAAIDLSVQIEVGAGVQLGDPPLPVNRATLDKVDLVVVDDRRWESLDRSARAALDSAMRAGLGVLLRPTGPLSAETRRDWASLGAPLQGGGEVRPSGLDTTAALNRHDLTTVGTQTIPVVRDKTGAALASWRARGQGRVGVWTVSDSYALVLNGQADRYGELWSQLFSALARPGDDGGVRIEGLARPGQRLALCDAKGPLRIVDPDGAEHAAAVDPATFERACAAYWPRLSGWHRAMDGARESAFYVHPADAAPSLVHAANREATEVLVDASSASAARSGHSPAGSPWPWAAALLAALGALWWLERRAVARPA